MVDIARDPRWGRIAEGAGEDPYLGAAMAAANVRGYQGERWSDPQTMLACAKHFAAYGAAEGGRDYNTVDLSERTLREIYLPPFKAAVDAGVATLMSSFNEIAGVPSSANRWLMTDVLRGQWKFNGFVVSDWEAILEMIQHGVGATRTDVGALALRAGVDMDMVSGIYAHEMVEAVRTQRIPEHLVNESVRRVLRVKFALGLFDNPYRNCDTVLEKRMMVRQEHLALARTAAQQAIVLLKNDGDALPLSKSLKRIAVVGPLADDKHEPRGPWAAEGKAEDVVTVVEGAKAKLPAARVVYARGSDIEGDDERHIAEAVKKASEAEAVIVVVGEKETMSGEAASRASIDLPGRQEALVRALHALGKPLVVVLMNGRPLTISWIAQHVAAVVEAWFLGSQSGNAIADVLFGDVNPSGKLPVTFARRVGQVPIYYNHKNTGRPPVDSLKYTSKYLDVSSSPLFPFGYGLSYTTFAYSNLRLSQRTVPMGEALCVTVDVMNSGKRDGEEIVQLYMRDEVASVTRPVKELKGFRRVALKAGEKKSVEFLLTPNDLSFYDGSMKRVIEPGWFTVMVGGSSEALLETRFEVR
ncbi:MAG: glycosyl hydrolase [Ignavibacteria bacterium]